MGLGSCERPAASGPRPFFWLLGWGGGRGGHDAGHSLPLGLASWDGSVCSVAHLALQLDGVLGHSCLSTEAHRVARAQMCMPQSSCVSPTCTARGVGSSGGCPRGPLPWGRGPAPGVAVWLWEGFLGPPTVTVSPPGTFPAGFSPLPWTGNLYKSSRGPGWDQTPPSHPGVYGFAP